MEIEIQSPVSGRCANVWVKDGALIDAGDVLMTIDPDWK